MQIPVRELSRSCHRDPVTRLLVQGNRKWHPRAAGVVALLGRCGKDQKSLSHGPFDWLPQATTANAAGCPPPFASCRTCDSPRACSSGVAKTTPPSAAAAPRRLRLPPNRRFSVLQNCFRCTHASQGAGCGPGTLVLCEGLGRTDASASVPVSRTAPAGWNLTAAAVGTRSWSQVSK